MHADVDGDALRHFVDTTQKLAPGSKAVPIATAAGGQVCCQQKLQKVTAYCGPRGDASLKRSPVAGSSVASSSTVYRNLPAEKLFLGTGLENVIRRKPKRGSDSVFISGPLAGLNHGIWFLSGTCGEVGSDYEVPTEAENLVKVHREHSSKDEILAFPIKIFSCFDGPTKKHDLIAGHSVMRKVPGERLAEVICRKFYNNQLALLDAIFENLGATLASFHDFQPSNIFYDDATDDIYFIDIGGMGLPTSDTDVELWSDESKIEHFRGAMTLLAGAYSPHEELAEAFQRGYGPACSCSLCNLMLRYSELLGVLDSG
ncbi:hypothetical protein AK812_SmicGene6304 [Symbiodinium microadriaticum]|uniref:Protein kinase domain-containing protein n=1 Tax=Symbiodinium microadriaticum TaxID=2951 RepID=A0A1Q9ERJ2_SYMMI|nr:hypothetical protein AK812_SmicGene6304 [Symbiodinium microadriaticum]